jgi:GTP pyrophosphokinase
MKKDINKIDRCNNLTTMSWGLSRDRIYRMIRETEEYFPRLLKVVKAETDFNNAAWLLQYHMESMLDIYKRLM